MTKESGVAKAMADELAGKGRERNRENGTPVRSRIWRDGRELNEESGRHFLGQRYVGKGNMSRAVIFRVKTFSQRSEARIFTDKNQTG